MFFQKASDLVEGATAAEVLAVAEVIHHPGLRRRGLTAVRLVRVLGRPGQVLAGVMAAVPLVHHAQIVRSGQATRSDRDNPQ